VADDDVADDDVADDDVADDDVADDDTGDDDTGGEPDIETDPQELNFGEVQVGDAGQEDLEIQNVGDADLNVTGVTAQPPHFTPSAFSGIIHPGGSQTIQVEADCVNPGPANGMVVIASNDPDESDLQVAAILTCTP